MKSCPECGTLYEDYVDTCLVDGAELAVASEQNIDIMAGTVSASDDEKEEGGGRGMLIILLFGGLVFAVLAAIVLFVLFGSGEPKPGPVPVPPVVQPVEPAVPVPDPEPVVLEFTLVTVPAGASVKENGNDVCTTPCTLKHPDFAVLPRIFRIELSGYQSEDYQVDDATGMHRLRLAKVGEPPRPRPRPRPVRIPTPTPSPMPAPSPVTKPTPDPDPVAVPVPKPTPKPDPIDFRVEEIKNPFD